MIEFKRRIEDNRGVIEGMKAHIGDLSTQVTKYMVHVELQDKKIESFKEKDMASMQR